MGRRRPFILLYSIGILVGLVLVPNGHTIGLALGDTTNVKASNSVKVFNETSNMLRNMEQTSVTETQDMLLSRSLEDATIDSTDSFNISDSGNESEIRNESFVTEENSTVKVRAKRSVDDRNIEDVKVVQTASTPTGHIQPWSIAFTVIGTMLLDFCSDACQSPSRTYLLDVSLPDDHAAGLSTFTLMAGLGGSLGYVMGAIHWENTFWETCWEDRCMSCSPSSQLFSCSVSYQPCAVSRKYHCLF
ncbi:hypothetical protein CEXT_402341 [Caerostris extrusa]|uniref:Uncharacterized protein n=1 Tax=Caerostris extrusa TaxID=172846 RepID=A0AAV4VHN6_CAEEX|nr:hypothetical protein CEXT_402341 [Caerostris extrusa]